MYFDKITVGPCVMSNISITVNHDGTECKGTLPHENVEGAIDLLVNEMEKINSDYEYLVHSLCVPSELEVQNIYDVTDGTTGHNITCAELRDSTVASNRFTACGYYVFEDIEVDEVTHGSREGETNTITFSRLKAVLASSVNTQKLCN